MELTKLRTTAHKVDGYDITFTMSKMDAWKAKNVPNGDLELVIREPKKSRTLDQNAYFWELVGQMARVLGADNYEVYLALLEAYTTPMWMVIPKAARDRLLADPFRIVNFQEEHDNGTVTALCWYSSKYLDTKEFSALLDGTLEEAKQVGIDPEAVKLGLMEKHDY